MILAPVDFHISPAMRFRPMSPFLEMLIEHTRERVSRPEGLVAASITEPRRIEPETARQTSPVAPNRLDRSV